MHASILHGWLFNITLWGITNKRDWGVNQLVNFWLLISFLNVSVFNNQCLQNNLYNIRDCVGRLRTCIWWTHLLYRCSWKYRMKRNIFKLFLQYRFSFTLLFFVDKASMFFWLQDHFGTVIYCVSRIVGKDAIKNVNLIPWLAQRVLIIDQVWKRYIFREFVRICAEVWFLSTFVLLQQWQYI